MKNLSTIPLIKRTLNAVAIVVTILTGLLGLHSEANGQITVMPGFTVETFATGVSTPAGMSFGPNGDLFVGNDFNTNATVQIYKITPAGIVSAFGDPIPDPDAVLADAAGNVFVGGVVVATGQGRVSKISPDGSVTSLFASGGGLGNISDMVFDGAGNIIAPNEELGTISSVDPAGVVSTLVTGLDVSAGIAGIAFGLDGNLYLARYYAGTITKISPTGAILDPAFASGLSNPLSISLGPGGVFGTDFYVAEENGEISVISSAGQVTTFASGISTPGFPGLEFGPDGNLYVREYVTGRILRIRPSGATSCVPPPSGLLSWWPGDGNANDIQSSNHGTLVNGATFAPGLVDQAFSFDGNDDYLEVQNSPNLNPTHQISVEAWHQTTSFAGNGTNSIVHKEYFTHDPPFYQYHLGVTGNLYPNTPASFNFRVAVNGNLVSVVTGSNFWIPGNWYHLVGTYDGLEVKLYVNGVLRASTPASGTMTDYGKNVLLGAFANLDRPGIDYTPGIIDEASIYNRALTAQEIADIYNASSAGKCKECMPPEVSITGNDPVFTGTTHTYAATTDATNPSFGWSVTGGTINGINTNSSVSVTAGAVGTMMVRVNVTDGVTNCSKEETKNVTVNPLPAGSNEVVFATNSVWLKEHAKILSGNVIVNNASSGPVLDSQVELSVGQSVTTSAGFALKANRIKVKQGATVASDIFYNELTNNGTINGSQNSPLTLPVFASLPPFHQAPAGTQDITVNKDESITLTAGAYRDILVKQNGTILFMGGGTFALRSLNTGAKTKLLFDSPTEILIAGKLDTDENSYVGPQSGSGIGAADIVFYIAGSNGNNGNFGATPKAAQLGLKNTVLANFYVPNGTLWLRQGTVATGAFLGRDVIVGEQVQVTLESAFDGGGSLAKSANNEGGEEQRTSTAIPEAFALLQNYPNPFNPSTMISFALSEAGLVQLTIYNLHGQEVRTLINGQMNAGFHSVNWNGKDDNAQILPSGVYLYKLRVNGFAQTRKMTFMK